MRLDVWKVYGSGEAQVIALRGVSVELERGRFTAIMGPSGSGKSTLMHCLAGLDSVTRGEVYIGDTAVTGLRDAGLTKLRRDKVGFIFQQFNLLPTLTAEENILLPLSIAGRKPDQTVVRHRHRHRRPARPPRPPTRPTLRRPAATRRLRPRPRRPARGHLRRRAHRQPRLPLRRRGPRLPAQLASASFGQTIVMVTHDPNAASYADRVIFLADGQIVDEMRDPTAEAVLDRLKSLDVHVERRRPATGAGGATLMLRATLREPALPQAAAGPVRGSPSCWA